MVNMAEPTQDNLVDRRNGNYYVSGSRVSLASIIYEHKDGSSVETILENFPTLSIPQITAALEFYQANRLEVETHLRDSEASWKTLEESAPPLDPALQERIADAKRRLWARSA